MPALWSRTVGRGVRPRAGPFLNVVDSHVRQRGVFPCVCAIGRRGVSALHQRSNRPDLPRAPQERVDLAGAEVCNDDEYQLVDMAPIHVMFPQYNANGNCCRGTACSGVLSRDGGVPS